MEFINLNYHGKIEKTHMIDSYNVALCNHFHRSNVLDDGLIHPYLLVTLDLEQLHGSTISILFFDQQYIWLMLVHRTNAIDDLNPYVLVLYLDQILFQSKDDNFQDLELYYLFFINSL